MSIYDRKLFGEQLFRLTPDRCPRRVGEIPVLTQRWQAPSGTEFQLGEEPDGWPGMRITMIDSEEEIPGEAYIINVEAEGLPDADGSSSLVLSHDEDLPQEGWDIVNRRVYTTEPNAAHLLKGGQLMGTALTGVTGTASSNVFTKTAHGLTNGRLADLTFSSGFGGATSGSRYTVLRLDADTLHLLDTTAFYVTGVASTDVFTNYVGLTATAHGLTDGTAVAFTKLKNGSGLSTYTVYYVRDATSTTFKLAATVGGSAINFTTDAIWSTGTRTQLRRVLDLSSDGTGGTLTPVMLGYERLWITDRRKSKARGCIEAEALGNTGYYYVDVQLKGLNQVEGERKQILRRGGGSAQALRVENFGAATIVPRIYTGAADDGVDAGSSTYSLSGNVEFDLPQVGLQETLILTEPPPTWMLGSGTAWTPDNADPVSYVSLTGSNDTMHFPAGWKIGNIQYEQIPGQSLYLLTFTWLNQRTTTPGT